MIKQLIQMHYLFNYTPSGNLNIPLLSGTEDACKRYANILPYKTKILSEKKFKEEMLKRKS